MLQLDRQLAEVASRQRMLITIHDVQAAGGTYHHARQRVRSGRWHRLSRGVYLISGAPLDWPARQLAAVLAAGPGAVTSHFAAARLWGLPGFTHASVELSVPRHHRPRHLEVRVHESTDLDRADVRTRDGIPVTGPARTVLDVGRFVGIQRLTRCAEAARRMGLVDRTALLDVVASHARQGRHGIGKLRAVILDGIDRSEVTDTDMELLVLGLIREAGLPEPVLHHEVYDGDRFVAEVDLAYPELMIAIECDGSVHLVEEVRDRDLHRQNDLVLSGWVVLRFSYERVRRRPDLVVAEVRDAIRGASQRRPA
jgi:hypothetical protein